MAVVQGLVSIGAVQLLVAAGLCYQRLRRDDDKGFVPAVVACLQTADRHAEATCITKSYQVRHE